MQSAAAAERLKLQFVDADDEIEDAAGCSISDIFELHGEQAFRDGERRVIQRLLDGPVKVIATGGGAFMNEATRAAIKACAHSIWLRADYNTLWRRVSRRNNRPLLKTADPRALCGLIEEHSVYAEANLIVDSTDGPRVAAVDEQSMHSSPTCVGGGQEKEGDDAETVRVELGDDPATLSLAMACCVPVLNGGRVPGSWSS